MTEGVSTRVYRVRAGGEVYYLRVLPEPDASFAPEVLAHRLLREKGVHAPDVVHFEHCNTALQRSIMLTTEVKGTPVDSSLDPGDLRRVLYQAGAELAIVNSVPVAGFGWIRRDNRAPAVLGAEHATWSEFLHEQVDEPLALLGRAGTLCPRDVQAIAEAVVHCGGCLGVEQARLAHGDFDPTHIYHEQARYTGIIDWGEIRGTDPFYDLGCFRCESSAWLPYLLEGYAGAAPLPVDYERRLHFSSLYVAVNHIGRRVRKGLAIGTGDRHLASMRESLQALLA